MATIRYDYGDSTIRNQPISEALERVLLAAAQSAGVDEVVVFSGGQHAEGEGNQRTGSTRHDHGEAADIRLMVNGRMLDFTNPQDQAVFANFAQTARANGAGGIGAGQDYMGPNSMHVGFGTPAVWGAEGRSANAPQWLRTAYNAGASGAPMPPAPVGGQGRMATAGVTLTNPSGNGDMLRQGSSGDRVRQLQQFLNDQGANIAVDGQFGPQTAAAVRNYQRQNGLQVDGIVGPQTFGQISADRQAPSQPLNLRDRIERFLKARQNGAPFREAFDYARGAASWDGRNQWAQDNPTTVSQAPQSRPESPPPPIPQVRPEQSAPTPRPRPEPPRPPMPTQAFGWPQTQQRGFAPPPMVYSAPTRGTAIQPYDATRNANAIRNDPGAAPTGVPGFDAVAALGAPTFDATEVFAAPVKAEKQFSLSPSTVAGPIPPQGELGTDTYKDLMTRRAALLDPDPAPKFPPPLGPAGVYAVTGKSTLPPAPRTPTMAGFGMATNPPVVSPPVTTVPQLVARKLFGNATA